MLLVWCWCWRVFVRCSMSWIVFISRRSGFLSSASLRKPTSAGSHFHSIPLNIVAIFWHVSSRIVSAVDESVLTSQVRDLRLPGASGGRAVFGHRGRWSCSGPFLWAGGGGDPGMSPGVLGRLPAVYVWTDSSDQPAVCLCLHFFLPFYDCRLRLPTVLLAPPYSILPSPLCWLCLGSLPCATALT